MSSNNNMDLGSIIKPSLSNPNTSGNVERVVNSALSPAGGLTSHQIVTPDEFDASEYQVVKHFDDDAVFEELSRATDEKVNTGTNMLQDLLAGAIEEESSRVKELDERLENDVEFKETVAENNENAPVTSIDRDSVKTLGDRMAAAQYSTDDFVPAYDTNEEEEVVAEDDSDKKSYNLDDADEQLQYLKELKIVEADHDTKPSLVKVVHERVATIETIPSKKLKTLNDQAFVNSIKRFKKDNFRTVNAPLINSGFFIDIVGTGAVDLTTLYTSVAENITSAEYEIEKMRVVLGNVVATSPKIDPMKLNSMIHYIDYQIMAWAHICATLPEVVSIHECPECGTEFRVTANPAELLLNADEIRAKAVEISNASTIDECSLLAKDTSITTRNGYEVVIGHPSYIDMVNLYRALSEYSQQMSPSEAKRFNDMSTTLALVRDIIMPNGVKPTTIYQKYLALKLLNTDEMTLVTETAAKVADNTIIPRFGIKSVRCPHCKKVSHDIPYGKLDEMVFFHTMVTPSMN